jgi:hypothetical protein
MSEEHLFTCKECGSHDIQIVCEYKIINEITETLPCECENTEDDIAAERTYSEEIDYQDYGYLDDEHRVDWAVKHEKTNRDESEEKFDVYCDRCLEKYGDSEQNWKIEDEPSEEDEESIEFWVYCDECNREIEFGWSHPERGGRIWPAECIDFNPWKSWPEPRYVESWKKKGWLRPIK